MAKPYSIAIVGQTYTIRAEMVSALDRYIEEGLPPGEFLKAILENDFVGATVKADADNFANLPAYANFLYFEVPSAAWGSKEQVERWIAQFRKDNKP